MGYKSLAQIPARRNGPVSSNVRPRTAETAAYDYTQENSSPMRKEMLYLEQGSRSDELLVIVHGFATPDNRLQDVRKLLRQTKPNADIYAPLLPYTQRLLSTIKAEALVAKILGDIDSIVKDRMEKESTYLSITFIGHSSGAVIARRLVIAAHGERFDKNGYTSAPFEPELKEYLAARDWAPKIARLILIAGMNRGWSVESTRDWYTSVIWSIGQAYCEYVLRGNATVLATRRGAPFLVSTRLQWLSLMNREYGKRPDLITVQLLGSIDDHVAPDDNIDWTVDIGSEESQRTYYYLDVPHSTHSNIIKMSQSGSATTSMADYARKERLLLALTGSRSELDEVAAKPEEVSDPEHLRLRRDVTDVVFVIHGIRDRGHWTQKVARSIKRRARLSGRTVISFTASYGYFAMAPFLFRPVRQRKVEWLMDRYVEMRATYPIANIHYVGHSNGTYLLAQALQEYPGANFGNVVFAGSVVRTDFDWLSFANPCNASARGTNTRQAPKVNSVLNYVSTRDWVVALFPKGLQRWKGFNLGGAGHDGFLQASNSGPIHQIKYIQGGHGAGVEEAHWNDIAEFIVSGKPPETTGAHFSENQSLLWKVVGSFSFLLLPLAAILAITCIVAFAIWIQSGESALVGALRTVISGGFFGLVYILLTMF